MASPILYHAFKAPKARTSIPKAMQTALFTHRIRKAFTAPKQSGHKVIHQPILAIPKKPVIRTGSLFPPISGGM